MVRSHSCLYQCWSVETRRVLSREVSRFSCLCLVSVSTDACLVLARVSNLHVSSYLSPVESSSHEILSLLARYCVLCLWHTVQEIIRPLGTVVPDGLLFHRRCFLGSHISEVPLPIAQKLCHMIGIWPKRSRKLQKFLGRSPKKYWGPKTCKISVEFLHRPTLIANIPETA